MTLLSDLQVKQELRPYKDQAGIKLITSSVNFAKEILSSSVKSFIGETSGNINTTSPLCVHFKHLVQKSHKQGVVNYCLTVPFIFLSKT